VSIITARTTMAQTVQTVQTAKAVQTD